jgi:quercetin dioxygenase-like cupin family protein
MPDSTSTEPIALETLSAQLLAQARDAAAKRAAHTLTGGSGHLLRQTLIALPAGTDLDEHESPGEATIQVLSGRVSLHAADADTLLEAGQYMLIPDTRHSLSALDDAAVLLTVAVRQQ